MRMMDWKRRGFPWILAGILMGCGGEGASDGPSDTVIIEDVESGLESGAVNLDSDEPVVRTAESGFAFIPDTLTVAVDEEIVFILGEEHTALQTDFNGWKAGAQQSGGWISFSSGFGGRNGSVR